MYRLLSASLETGSRACGTCQRAYAPRKLLCRKSRSEALWEQNSLWWQAVTRSYIYVNFMWTQASPLIPSLVSRVFSSPKTNSLWKGTKLLAVEACLSLFTYQTKILILSAADWLIRLYQQEKPGHSLPQASHAWRTEEFCGTLVWVMLAKNAPYSISSPRQQGHLSGQIMMIHHQEEAYPRDKREFWKVARQQQRLSNICLLLL